MSDPAFTDLLGATRRRAWHLEARDSYTPADPAWTDWRAGKPIDPLERYPNWRLLIRPAAARGVEMRRARIVSEPISDYVRFEHEITDALNVGAGEQVRWLPRHRAPQILTPVADFWLFDTAVMWNHFAGDGTPSHTEVTYDPGTIQACARAFEAVWSSATPHAEYHPD